MGEASATADTLSNRGAFSRLSSAFPPLTGLWTTQVWTQLVLFENAAVDGSWLSLDLSVGAVALVAFLLLRGAGRISERAHRLGGPLAVLAMAAAAGLCALSRYGSPGDWAPVLTAALGGAGLGWGYLLWASAYLRVGVGKALRGVLMSSVVAVPLRAAAVLVPFPARMAASVAVAVLMMVLARRALGEEAEEAEPLYRIGSRSSVASLAVLVSLFACVCNALRVNLRTGAGAVPVGVATMLAALTLELAVLGALYALVFLRGRALGFTQLWGFVAVFLASAALLSSVPGLTGASYTLSCVANDLTVVFVWLALADVSRHAPWDPYGTFALGWCLYAAAKLLGKLLSGPIDLLPAGVAPAALLWAVAIAMVCCLGSRRSLLHRVFSELDVSSLDPSDFDTIDDRCEQLGRLHGLTERECAVMKGVCRGKSKSAIATELYISENTVRGHAKRLYAKLGVHSKEELRSLLGMSEQVENPS